MEQVLTRLGPWSSDAELVSLIRQGTAPAFAVLMRRNNQRLFRLARSILKDDFEAEDAVQEAYIRAFTNLDAFKGTASLSTWLARITVNEALGRLRRRKPVADLEDLDTMTSSDRRPTLTSFGPFGPINPEEAAARGELRALLEKAIDELPASFRAVFILRAIEQLSVEETAACLDIPKDTVKTRFHRARRLIRQNLGAAFASILADAFAFAGARCDRIVASVLSRLGMPEEPADSSGAPLINHGNREEKP